MSNICVCFKPATNRCSGCKSVSYCSQDCQVRDWKSHKKQCQSAARQESSAPPQVGSAAQMKELLRVGAQVSIYEDAVAHKLDPNLISGATGAEFFYDKNEFGGHFWRLEASARETWETEAQAHSKKSARFWTNYLAPITKSAEWVDVVLDAILYARLPSQGVPFWQGQVNSNILAGLFPHLSGFTPAQNTALLDIFASQFWYERNGFRLSVGAEVLFAHGKPSINLIEQLVRRCLGTSPPRKHAELDALTEYVALRIQKYWPDIAGTRILDCVFAMLMRRVEATSSEERKRKIPSDQIIKVAETSPAACKHLLPAILAAFHAYSNDEHFAFLKDNEGGARMLHLFETLGVAIRSADALVPELVVEFIGDDANTRRLQKLLKEESEGKLAKFGIEARDYNETEMKTLYGEVKGRLEAMGIVL